MTCYTYIIGWSDLNKYYYGVRVANALAPKEDLWNEYFTSSQVVKKYRDAYGEPDVVKIDAEFDVREDALAYELNYLKENKCVTSDVWLNQAAFPMVDNRGRVITDEEKRKISASVKASWKNRAHRKKETKPRGPRPEETKRKISLAMSKPRKPRSEETKAKISATLKARKEA
jgi:hypothetical protein